MRAPDWNGHSAPVVLMAPEPYLWDRPHPDDGSLTHLEFVVQVAKDVGADGLEFFPWNFHGVQAGEVPDNKVSAFSRSLLRWALDELPFHVIRIFGQRQGNPSTFPWAALRTDNPHMQRVVRAVEGRDNVAYSLGIDCWEWIPDDAPVDNFFDAVAHGTGGANKDPLGTARLWGVRSEPGDIDPRTGPVAMSGEFLFDHSVAGLRADLDVMISWAGGRPLYADDRFRIDVDQAEKDFRNETELARLVALCRQMNVGSSVALLRGPDSTTAHARGCRRFEDMAMMQAAFVGQIPGEDPPPPPPPDFKEMDMPIYHIDRQRSHMIAMAVPEVQSELGGEWDATWGPDSRNAEAVVELKNNAPFIVHRVEFFGGIDVHQHDEYSLAVDVMNSKGAFQQIAAYQVEKDSETSGFDAHHNDSVAPVMIPAQATVRFRGLHTNLVNRAHANATIYAFFAHPAEVGSLSVFGVPDTD